MKVTPVAGTGVPAQSNSSLGQTASPTKLERAKAIASGDVPRETSGDPQVDKVQNSIRKIKMRTQVSTNRHDAPVEEPVEEVATQNSTKDTNEQVNGTEETKPIDPEVAALLKYKRSLQVKERELAEREEALKAQPPVNNGDMISKTELLANPLKVFEAGVTYDQLTEAILNGGPTPVDPIKLRNEIKEELKKELLGEFGTRDQQAEQQVLTQIEREINELVESKPDEYEAIRLAKAQPKVKELIHRTWKKTGEVLSEVEAANLVEEQLIEDATPFMKIKKVQSRLNPQEEQVAQQPIVPKPGTKIMRTLTNRDNASPVMDKRARAIAAMEGRLKR